MIRIALLAGGDSSERDISLQSAAQVAAVLDKNKYDVRLIDVRGRLWTHRTPSGEEQRVDLNDFSLDKKPFDYALILIHGTPGEDGLLQGYLELLGVPFSSGGQVSSVLTFDKATTKLAVCARGVRVARGRLIGPGEAPGAAELVAELGLPLFVKPNASGSSFGVTKVKKAEDLPAAVAAARAESAEILIEECLTGRELACGILVGEKGEAGEKGKEDILFPITEIRPRREFFDYAAKYTPGASEELTPADLPAEITAELHRLTREACRACRCRGVVRVDFILTPAGVPYLIEINSIPGMSSGSIVPQQVRAAGMSVGELFDEVIARTYDRDRR